MLEIRKCCICGKEFEACQHNHICCSSECRYEKTKRDSRTRKRARRKKDKPKSLRELSVEATAHGMSYGKYVAMLEAQGRSDAIAKR